ncbi:CDP-diacylglycerol diphosphatase [Pararobbsia alpina]|uniref:CDP-diacylglycerol pyrophosphatase n=1 Tax=Pararobbsia alpina TaxID=621374 RepID=A0A6S7BBR1_9BURK|nr:CDP-diacylglycerol diphosphatase [Pararobbsia alpina]CAB3794015.1 CDP-diacylglycerol pyrophosphatase [Pararobbsia alpina]
MKSLIRGTLVPMAVLAAMTLGACATHPGNPNALWNIVSKQCVPQANDPSAHNACAYVDLAGGYAVLKDIRGVGQHLLIPTEKISGIDSPRLEQPGLPNYWRDAWEARVYVERSLHTSLPPEDIGLAINSASGRSQNQLHIHIDCMQPEVVAALSAQRASIGESWRELDVPLEGHRYRARLITDGTLRDTDPFALLVADTRARGESMADQTLLLTGTTLADGKPAFILLNDHVHGLDRGSAEELLDHDCHVRGR